MRSQLFINLQTLKNGQLSFSEMLDVSTKSHQKSRAAADQPLSDHRPSLPNSSTYETDAEYWQHLPSFNRRSQSN